MQICTICNKSFKSLLALAGHKRMHGKSNGTRSVAMCCCIITRKEIESKSLVKFQSRIKYCKCCNTPLDSYRSFCNQSCAATFNNANRINNGYTVSLNTKQKISESLTKTTKLIQLQKSKVKVEYIGVFSKVYNCKCKHCKIKFVSRTAKQYCVLHRDQYCNSAKSGYKFTFNVYKYPDLFNLEHINQTGWYSRGGTAGKYNPSGLTRDHKISVNAAIRNNYDPYYITHPLNCEIMPWLENNKKKTNSSITYSELVTSVDAYEIVKAHQAGLEPAYGFPNTTD